MPWYVVNGNPVHLLIRAEHGVEVGRDRHYCPAHLARHREAEPELF